MNRASRQAQAAKSPDPARDLIRKKRCEAIVSFFRSAYCAPVATLGSLVTQLIEGPRMKGIWTRREIMLAIEDLVRTGRACVMADEPAGTLCVITWEAAEANQEYYASLVGKNGECNVCVN